MKERWRGLFGRHRKKVLFGFVLGVVFMLFFGAKIVLYVQFLLGNDIVIELTPGVEEITIAHGEEKKVEVEVKASANPFCEVSCTEKWIDLASLHVVKKEGMILYLGVSSTRSFSITAKGEDERYGLYRYEVACQGKESLLCHTKEKPTEREVLVKVHIVLNEEENKKKEGLNVDLNKIEGELKWLQRVTAWESESVAVLNGTILQSMFDAEVEQSKGIVQKEERWMDDARALWKEQQFASIQKLIVDSTIEQSVGMVGGVQQEINGTIEEYNNLVAGLNERKEPLKEMQQELPVFNQSVNDNVMVLSEKYNLLLQNITAVDFKTSKMLFDNLTIEFGVVRGVVMNENKIEQREKALELLLNQRMLCTISGVCGNSSLVTEIMGSTGTVMQRCGEVKKFVEQYTLLQMQMKELMKGVGYAQDKKVLDNVSMYVQNIRESEKAGMLLELQTVNKSEFGGMGLLKLGTKEKVSFAANVNVTPLAVLEMGSFVQECMLPNVILGVLENVTIGPIMLPEVKWQEKKVEFGEQIPKCCVLGSCSSCCVEKSCGKYPLLFIHGHAFNKDLSAEYSLNAFNALQTKLEEEGYVNAGVVSLYTPTTEGVETWGEFVQPMSVKGSYYYDTYFTAGGYTLVQQKSERIETYALRLKELIETVQYKTGRDKVIIVAHSMGGLVSRRYMQLFGEGSVAKLIMIGTPNKGVVGNVAQYCDIIGEQRECEDMNEKSLFMGKLNAGKKPGVPTFAIVGIGCAMDGKEGDGVVLKENAQLDGAKTTFVKGSCEGLGMLHTEMLDVTKYPEVYTAIVEAVKG